MNTIDIDDQLVLYGYGVFETLRVAWNHIEVPELHYERMKRGAAVLEITLPKYSVWIAELRQIVTSEQRQEPYALRLTLSGGARSKVLSSRLIHHIRSIPYTAADYLEGVKVCILSHPRNEHSPCVSIKSTNAIENLLAKKEAAKKGAREGIWLNTKGLLAEGTVSNLFFVKDKVLSTPALECGCLPGTRRSIVMECARKLDIPVREGRFSPTYLEQADEVFLTNALMGLLPVKEVQNRSKYLVSQNPDSVTAQLQRIYEEFCLNSLPDNELTRNL